MAHVAIVGGGLAGALMGCFAARSGHDVTVFERRPDSRRSEYQGGRSINLALSTRGLTALDAIGLRAPVEAIAVPMRGRMMHARDGALVYQPYGRSGEANLSIGRRGLNEILLNALDRYPTARSLFESRVTTADPHTGELQYATPDLHGSATADLIIGADGAFSVVRDRFMHAPRFDYSQTYISHGYRELTIDPDRNGDWQLEPNALHIWPRHDFMLIALPNPDRTFTCTLFLKHEGVTHSFEAINDGRTAKAFFAEFFPDALARMPDLEDQYNAAPLGTLHYVRCQPWTLGRALLVGDAAHAVVPFYGQGMNAAFEDCRILDRVLAETPERDWLPAIAQFAASRKPDADAISELALQNFEEMRSRVAEPSFLARKALEHALSEAFPEWYRSLYELVSFTNTPYSRIRAIAAQQDAVLDQSTGAAALLMLGFVRGWSREGG